MLFDSHCHLGSPAYADDLERVIGQARDAGVEQIIAIGSGYGFDGNQTAVDIARGHEGIWATVGIHPHEAESATPQLMGQLADLSRDPAVVALGEMGLDFFRDRSPRDIQRGVFRDQLRLARRLDMPVVVHCRAAEEETLRILDEEDAFAGRVLIHCFTHDWAFARAVIERGGFLSVPGVITYPSAASLREAIVRVPNEVLLLETDGPFLTPVPHRGQRNEPAYLVHTAEAVARVKGLSTDDVARASSLATRAFFGLTEDRAAEGAIAYRIRNSVYLNATNRCTLSCSFCHKFIDFTVAGHYLNLRGFRPSADDLVASARIAATAGSATRQDLRAEGAVDGDLTSLDEVAFVGYGEPTTRLDVVLETARKLAEEHGVARLRLDTDGLVNLREGRDRVPEIAAALDAVTVSVNAPDGPTYAELCPNEHGQRAWEAAVAFLRACVDADIPWVQGTVVGVPGLDIDACRELVESTGARFRERSYHIVG